MIFISLTINFFSKMTTISHKYKFAYMRSIKVAGTSTEVLLDNLHDKNDKQLVQSNKNKLGIRSHSGPQQIKNVLGDKKFEEYFKFMTVRNPFDRVVSWYWWREGSWNKPPLSFKEYIFKEKCKGLLPFYDWMFLNGMCVIDDVIRFENLYDDTKRILNKWVSLDDFDYPKRKSSSRKSKKHYTEYYDTYTKKFIQEKYKKDIEYFGYEFGK